MRRFWALARTAAVEVLSEPLTVILFLCATLAVHALPAFHYHQFGEPGRLARECGLSSLLVFGLFFAVPAASRAIGREIESGTAAAALARAVSRPLFFCAKTFGVSLAFALFAAALALATETSAYSCVKGAEFGRNEGVVNVWGPAFAAGVGFTSVAFAAAAFVNRFRGWRFCLWACLLMAFAQVAAAGVAFGLGGFSGSAWEKLPVAGIVWTFVVLAAGCLAFTQMAAALATRLKEPGVNGCVALALASSFIWPVRAVVPDVNAFWLADALTPAGGGAVAPGMPLLAGACLIVFWTVAGSWLLEGRDVG